MQAPSAPTSGHALATAEVQLKAGKLEDALQALTAHVRATPADADARVFLFQVLAAAGQWERAENQLQTSRKMDDSNTVLAAVYGALLKAERVRDAVFAGDCLPTAIGEPEPWLALLLQAGRLTARGRHEQASELREQAFEQAPAMSGSIDGIGFSWLADADPRFGPCLEVVVNGGYVWAPFTRIRALRFEAPTALCDTLWAPVEIAWITGDAVTGFVPVRYPGSERSADPALQLARSTDWCRLEKDTLIGLGQRMFATDAGEYPLLETREIVFGGG